MGGEYYIKPNIYIGTEFGLMLIKTTYQIVHMKLFSTVQVTQVFL